MKNLVKVLTVLVLMCWTTIMYAQDTTKTTTTVITTTSTAVVSENNNGSSDEIPTMILGFRYMPTFMFLNLEPIDNSTVEATAQLGHGFGGYLGFNLSNHIGLQFEIIYQRLAQKFKYADRINNIRIDYINIPLLFRVNTGYDKPVNFNIVVGPQIGINTGSSINSNSSDGTTEVEAKLAMKAGDIGFAYGAGFDFKLGGYTKLELGFRGVYGIVDISDKSNNQTTEDYYVLDRAHIKTYAGYIGLAFGF